MANQREKHIIELEGMQVRTSIGYYPEERETGTDFIVNLRVESDFSGVIAEDRPGPDSRAGLDQTINYEILAEIVKNEMTRPAVLIEEAALRIKSVLLERFPRIDYLRLELKKQHPPLVLETASANIIIEYGNELS